MVVAERSLIASQTRNAAHFSINVGPKTCPRSYLSLFFVAIFLAFLDGELWRTTLVPASPSIYNPLPFLPFSVLFLNIGYTGRQKENAAKEVCCTRKESPSRTTGKQPQDRYRRFVCRFHLFFAAVHLLFNRSSKCWKIVLLQCSLRNGYLYHVGLYSFIINVVGLPLDLGKAANFPYATINPEEARVLVPDARFDWLCDLYKPVSRVPAVLTCIDIAGLTAVRPSIPFFNPLMKSSTLQGCFNWCRSWQCLPVQCPGCRRNFPSCPSVR